MTGDATGRAGQPSDSSTAPGLRYTLPGPSGALWLGLRPAAVAGLGGTVALTVLSLLVGAPVPVAVLLLAVGAAGVLWPVGGRTVLGWLPQLLSHTLAAVGTGRAWVAPLPTTTVTGGPPRTGPVDRPRQPGTAPPRGRRWSRRRTPDGADAGWPSAVGPAVRLAVPPECGRLRLVDLTAETSQSAPVGALLDRDRQTVAVCLQVTGNDRFAVLDPAGQDSLLAGWSSCLTTLFADPDLLHLQWLTHSRPHPAAHPHDLEEFRGVAELGESADLRGFGGELAGPGQPPPSRLELHRDQQQLAATVRQQALTHEHLLVLTLPAPQLAAAAGRPAGRRRGRAGPPAGVERAALLEHLRALSGSLLRADLLPQPLSAVQLGLAVRRLTDPTLPDRAAELSVGPPVTLDRVEAGRFGVLSRSRSWTCTGTDDAVHRGWAVAGWPQLALPADWLSALLHTAPPAGTSRTVAVHADPVPPIAAGRQARAAVGKARLDAADRQRLGFTASPTDSLAEQDAAAVQTELVAGYRLAQLSALVSVAAPDPDQLRAASRSVHTAAAGSHLDLRPLHGQHHLALAGCLPLGRLPGAAR